MLPAWSARALQIWATTARAATAQHTRHVSDACGWYTAFVCLLPGEFRSEKCKASSQQQIYLGLEHQLFGKKPCSGHFSLNDVVWQTLFDSCDCALPHAFLQLLFIPWCCLHTFFCFSFIQLVSGYMALHHIYFMNDSYDPGSHLWLLSCLSRFIYSLCPLLSEADLFFLLEMFHLTTVAVVALFLLYIFSRLNSSDARERLLLHIFLTLSLKLFQEVSLHHLQIISFLFPLENITLPVTDKQFTSFPMVQFCSVTNTCRYEFWLDFSLISTFALSSILTLTVCMDISKLGTKAFLFFYQTPPKIFLS